jgi:hypothetical protein
MHIHYLGNGTVTIHMPSYIQVPYIDLASPALSPLQNSPSKTNAHYNVSLNTFWVDASFAVYPNIHSHTGAATISPIPFTSNFLWLHYVIHHPHRFSNQDNESALKMESK